MSKNNENNSFLSQFEGKSYASNKDKPQGAAPEEKRTVLRAAPARPGASESKSKIQAPDHLVVEDKSYHKRKMAKWGIIGATTVALGVLIFFGIRMLGSVEVMDFSGTTWQSATQWGIQHRITLQQNNEYSIEYDEGVIFGQNIEPGTSIQSGSVLILDVSLGPDMTEVLDLPNFEDMTTGEINTWRTQNRIGNAVQVREESHETIEAGRFISLEHPPAVDLAHFTRRDNLTLTMSSGPRTFTMPNFVGRNQQDVEEWADENDVPVTFETVNDASAEVGVVLEQSIEARARFTLQDNLVITVSAGEAVIVPNFSLLSQEDAAEVEGLTVVRRDRFSATVPFGRVIEQSIPAGTELLDENPTVTVIYSLGRPFIDNLIGQSESVLARLFFENFVSKGANVTYTVRYVDSYEPRGQIINMSRFAEFIGMNDHITIDVSRGNLTPPEPVIPSFPEPPAPPSNGQDIDWPTDEGASYENGDNE